MMWHQKNIKPTDLLNPEVWVKQEKDHYDGDSKDEETTVKQEDHAGDGNNGGETTVKQEDHYDGDRNGGETIVKEEKGETRHWFVCDGGFLNEIKKPHAWSVETSADENERRVDNNSSYVGAVPTTFEPCTCSSFTKDVKSSCHPHGRKTIHAGVKAYICSTWGKSLSKSSSHSRHKSIDTGKRPYACSTCGTSFATDSQCKSHEKIHMIMKPYACSTCGKSFVTDRQ